MPKISVIIPCYNLGQYLDEAVDSVLAQTFQDFEIIIVNDGSTDEFTNKLLARYEKPKTRVLATENRGLPSARNNGIRVSGGEYICCLDADDRYEPQFLEKCSQVLDDDTSSKFGFVTTWVRCFGGRGEVWETGEYDPPKLIISNRAHVASMFRKEAWEKTGGYSTNLPGYQDWDFWLKIVAHGYTWALVREPLFDYRVRDDSMIKASDLRRQEIKEIILKKNICFVEQHAAEVIIEYDRLIADNNRSAAENLNYIRDLEEKVTATSARLREAEDELQIIHNWFIFKLLRRINCVPGRR